MSGEPGRIGNAAAERGMELPRITSRWLPCVIQFHGIGERSLRIHATLLTRGAAALGERGEALFLDLPPGP